MPWPDHIDLVDVHCGGEIGRVVLPGAIDIPGSTLIERMNFINRVDDRWRRFLVFEPRGAVHMSVNLLFPPTDPEADIGFFVLQADRAHPMSGSNLICVVTAALEHGIVPMREPETAVRVETPVGLIDVRAVCAAGRCLSVSFENVPAFVEKLDWVVSTASFGSIRADIAFGGVYYGLVDADQCGLHIRPEAAQRLVSAGLEIKAALDAQLVVRHPLVPDVDRIAYVMFREREAPGLVRTCTVLEPGRVDRSPCGTGSSANLAAQYARQTVGVGDRLASRSIVGGEFAIEVAGTASVGDRAAVVPRVTGQAWVYAQTRLRLDANDPFPAGFSLPDLW